MPLKFALLVLLLASYFRLCNSLVEKSICIGPSDQEGHQFPTLCAVTIDISEFCQDTTDLSNAIVTVFEGIHSLNTACEFKHNTNLTFRGTNNSTTVSCSSSSNETGLRFLNVSHLEISDIEFTSCGCTGYVVSNLYGLPNETLSALIFINGSSLTLTNVTVVNAVSAGIYIYNVVDYVTMDSCKVINSSSSLCGTVGGTLISYDNRSTTDTRLNISKSYFINSGYAFSLCKDDIEDHFFSCGLALYYGSLNLTVEIVNSTLSNNTGCNCGNMALVMLDYSHQNSTQMITITNTTFTGGISRYGGGLCIAIDNTFSGNYKFAKLEITKSTFCDNFAHFTGGGIYIRWEQLFYLKGIVEMNITNSTFKNNSIEKYRSGGLALDYMTYTDSGGEGYKILQFRVILNIYNCNFHNHISVSSSGEEKQLLESSVILAQSAPYLGIHNTNITSNNCTAILAIGTTLVFYGSSRISNNTAFMGAGLTLCSGSVMYLTPHMELVITNNSVQRTGGGIQVSSNCLVSHPMCFYQFSSEVTKNYTLLSTINVTINNNRFPHGENNIFGGSLDYCYLLYLKRTDIEFKHKLNVPNNTVSNPSSISSSPQRICFSDNDSDRTDNVCKQDKHDTALIYPGQKLDPFFIRVVGQMNGSVPGTVLATVDELKALINESERAQNVNISGAFLNYTVYPSELCNCTSEEITLKLQAAVDSDTSAYEYIRHFKPAMIKIRYKMCPFGFTMAKLNFANTTSHYYCRCMTDFVIDYCSIESQNITKKKRTWIGKFIKDNKTYLATSYHGNCPLDYCNPEVSSVHSLSDSLDQDKQCRYNRTGVLCGSCKENWSLVLGSSECRDNCSNLYLLLILLFAVAGFLLVLIIHFLNLTVTMGTVCGLIFYANIVQDYVSTYSIVLLSEYPFPVLTPILQVFLAWLNLDLGIQTCFYEGMEAFGKTMLLYIFPIYIWLISAVIIFLSNRYIRVTRLVGENAVKVLATLFLLSYSKMLRVSLGSLNVRVINVHINSTTSILMSRWVLDGNIAYFDDNKHLLLFVIGFLFFIITLPVTMSLLCLKHVYSLSNCSRLFSWIDKLKPFFDTYTGPYKDKARFWTGLLLLVRIVFLVIHTFDFKNQHTPYVSGITICLVLISIMMVLNGIYKSHHLNILESFFIVNLAILFLTRLSSINGLWQSVVSHLLISSAFLTFLGIVGYHVYLFCKRWGRIPAFCHRNADLDVMSFDGMRGYERLEDEIASLMPVID